MEPSENAKQELLKTDTPSIWSPHGLRSGASWIASEPPAAQDLFLEALTDEELRILPYLFEFWAFDHQLPPEGDWRSWVILGGRGAGKTRAGSEWVRSMVEGPMPLDPGRASRVALVGETYDQVREVMIFGDSGLLAASPEDRRPRWEASRKRLVWPNGAIATVHTAHDPEGLRGPQFDAAWVDEYGCAAIDKGTNQPNKFLDPKSSESSLPKFSSGARDDFIQMQYIRAMNSFYAEAANNPVSALYGGPMVDMSKGFLWAWDARPYPWFPGNTELWSDGGNYPRGHWINGRTAARPLASVVEEICARAGLTEIDTSKLYGYVRGYEVVEVNSARAALQPLMLRYGFDAVERAGSVHFIMRDGQVPIDVEPDLFARVEELDGVTEAERDPELEISGRVRLQFVESDGSYDIVAEESVLPDEATHGVSTSEFALSMTRGEGRQTVERWLAEARVSRDKLKLALPPSQLSIAAGDVIRVPGAAGSEPTRFRVDRVEQGTYQLLEAVRIDPGVYTPADVSDEPPIFRPFVRPTPVTPIFLDLPLLRGDEVEHAPFVAATASNWPGSAAVYRSPAPSNYTFNTLLPARAVSGLSLTDLPAAPHGVTDRTAALMVQLTSGTLESVEDAALLAGANLAAIGDGSPDGWELIQFQNAELVGAQTYVLGNLLRGQQGTDALMPPLWPAGSRFVLLNGAVSQIDMAANYRNVTQYFRIGPAQLDVADPSYVDRVYAFAGNGLRPYAPAHLRAEADDLGDLQIDWTRRTRIDGDFWDGEVPLGETSEAYLLRVWSGGTLLREESPKLPNWTYTLADQISDGATGAVTLDVAQLSSRYGAGLSARLDIAL